MGSKDKAVDLESLESTSGASWVQWFSSASDHDFELHRSLQCLAALEKARQNCLPSLPNGGLSQTALTKPIIRLTGQAKCPSASACDKLAFRLKVLNGWLETAMQAHADFSFWRELVLQSYQLLLSRMYEAAEGADDKHAVLVQAIRRLTKSWLGFVFSTELSSATKAKWVFDSAMSDATGVIAPQVWWPAIAQCDRETIRFLAQQEIDRMSELQPSMAVGWKSYEKRWLRVRLKSVLTDLREFSLLSELMRKSAVDDFEAAQALEQLQAAGRHREAIAQGEKWIRVLPGSPVLAEALFKVYLHDGWDEEAQTLLSNQYRLDPNPKWLELLEKHFNRKEFPSASS
ncbi:MAG: hypothetical protein R3194_03490 [Limnobacter sp.]|nr:hypothetical protein [Limnobacter sp.]